MKTLTLILLTVAGAASPAQDLRETLKTLHGAGSDTPATTRALEPWLDENGFDRLRAALKEPAKYSAAEWQAVAMIEERLQRQAEALKAWENACAAKTGGTPTMRLGLARMLAGSARFADAVKAFEGMNDAQLDARTAEEVLWVLLGLSRSSGSDATALNRARALADARPNDLEIQITLFRFEARRGDPLEKMAGIRDRMAATSDPAALHRWRLLLIELALRAGVNAKVVVEHSLAGLEAAAAGSEDEDGYLRGFEEGWGRRQPGDKVQTTPQEVAAKFENRPAVVRVMAEALRADGSTPEALSLLARIPDDTKAKKMIADWAEEDGREDASASARTMAVVHEVVTKVAESAAPEWQQEVQELTGEALLKRLLELRRANPQNREVAFLLLQAWSRMGKQAEAQHELHRMELDLPAGQKGGEWVRQIALSTGRVWPGAIAVPEWPDWQEVMTDLREGRPHAAAMAMFQRADEPSLQAELAVYLSTGLMAWHEWQDAAVFLAAQRQRFPQDYRLACLHGITLKRAGNVAAAQEAFLSLGGYQKEIEQKRGFATTVEGQWGLISSAVNAALHAEFFLGRWVEGYERIDPQELQTLTPSTVEQAGGWGMAHLLAIASGLPEPERAALMERARASKLPLPDLLLAGKIETSEVGGNVLGLDPDWMQAHLEEDWVPSIWLTQLVQKSWRNEAAAELQAGAVLARRLADVLKERSPPHALQAALLAWRLQPEQDVTELLVDLVPKAENGVSQLLGMLSVIPLEARRKAATALMPVLRSSDDAGVLHGALLLGSWSDAAELFDALPEEKQISSAGAGQPPPWTGNSGSTVLHWPPPRLSNRMPYLGDRETWLRDDEKAAFLREASSFSRLRAKAAWLLSGGDEAGARQVVEEWLAAEPASRDALMTLACFHAHDGKLEEALDLLHGWLEKQTEPEARKEALSTYVQSAINRPGRRSADEPPLASHMDRLRAAALELLPALKEKAGYYLSGWAQIFAALNLKEEAAALSGSESARYFSQWRSVEEVRAELANRERSRRQFSPYYIKDMVSAGQTPRVVELILRSLRREADHRFFGRQEYAGGGTDGWQQAISEHGLAVALMEAAQPGENPSWRSLVKAVRVAEACSDWKQMVALAQQAQELQGHAALSLALLTGRMRMGDDPAAMMEMLRAMPRAEAHRSLSMLLQQAGREPDFALRLRVAGAALQLAREHPEIMRLAHDQRGQVLETLFQLLSSEVKDEKGHRVAEELYAEPVYDPRKQVPVAAEPATDEELALRQRLHGELCDLALKHDDWAPAAVRSITARHLAENQPAAEVLADYLRRAMKAPPPEAGELLNRSIAVGQKLRDGSKRLRLARLLMPLVAELPVETARVSFGRQTGLVELIGNEIPSAEFPPLWALWEYPMDASDGEYVHTPRQREMNKERHGLMMELWQAVQKHESLRREVFPAWAAFRLHSLDTADEVLQVARSFRATLGDPCLLRALLEKAALSYENSHHILTGELVVALLSEDASLLREPTVSEAGKSLVQLLLAGRHNQSEPMPPLSTPDEEAKLILGEKWHARRLAVLSRLSELFQGSLSLPPSLIFTELQRQLMADKDTQEIEKRIASLAPNQIEDVVKELSGLIYATRGRHQSGNSYVEGVWELPKRLEWFGAAFRIGRTLPVSHPDSNLGDGWLTFWIDELSLPNKLCLPPVPPLLGREKQADWGMRPPADYQAQPLLKRREEMVLEGLEMAMQSPERWEQHLAAYTHLQISRHGKAGIERVKEVLERHARKRPATLLKGLSQWNNPDDFPTTEAKLAAAALLDQVLDRLPVEEMTSYILEGWQRIITGVGSTSVLPLLPDKPWMFDSYAYGTDVENVMKLAGNRERLAAWLDLLEKMESIPQLAAASFKHQVQIHLEKSPERIIKMALSFTDEQWFQAERVITSLYSDGESHVTAARRADWGRLALLWQEESAKRLKRSPQYQSYRTWAGETLKYLRKEWKPQSSDIMPPPDSPEDIGRRDEMAQKLSDMLLADPVESTEGFQLFAKSQFDAQATATATLKIAKEALQRDSAAFSRQVEGWCRDVKTRIRPSTEECVWAGGILVQLAEMWPPEEDARWVGAAGILIAEALYVKDERQGALQTLLDQLVDRAFRLRKPDTRLLASYARWACQTEAGAENLKALVSRLATADPVLAAAWLRSWWTQGDHSSPVLQAEGIVALKILRQWPATAAAETLDWCEGLVFDLGAPLDFTDRNLSERPPHFPAPGLAAESRQTQQEVLNELDRRQLVRPWMLALRLRLAVEASLDDSARRQQLKPFFEPPRRSSTVEMIRTFLKIDLNAMQAQVINRAAFFSMERNSVKQDAFAQQILDVSRMLQTAVREQWLAGDEAAELEKASREQLKTVIKKSEIAVAAQRQDVPWPVGVTGVQASQGSEANRLLNAWETASKPDTADKLTVQNLPSLVHEMLKDGTDITIITERVWRLCLQEPKTAAIAVEQWAKEVRERKDFDAYLRAGRFAMLLAQRWTEQLPAPDWLPVFVESWRLGKGFPGEWTPARNQEHRDTAAAILPTLHEMMRRYPACRYGTWFEVTLDYAQRIEKKTDREIAELALAHLRARPRGSVPAINFPRVTIDMDLLRERSLHQDAVLFLFDHLAATQDLEWWETECRPALEAAQERPQRVIQKKLELLATCPRDEFHLAHQNMTALGPIEALAWTLRTASRRKLDVDLNLWRLLAAPFRNDYLQYPANMMWLHTRELEGHDATADLRGLLRDVLGDEYGSAAMKAVFRNYVPERNNFWQGWPYGRSSLKDRESWKHAYDVLEFLAENSSGHFRAVLEVSKDMGLDAVRGAVAHLMSLRPNLPSSARILEEWKRVLDASGVVSDLPDPIWLTPHDGHVPIWEFAERVGLSNYDEPIRWLDAKQREKPDLGTALLILARGYRPGQELLASRIEAALTPCRNDLKRASKETLAALSAALHVAQPELFKAAVRAGPDSVLKLIPAPVVSDESYQLAASWLTRTTSRSDSSSEVKQRLAPLAADVLALLAVGNVRAHEVAKHGISLLAAEDWQEVMPEGFTREAWLWEHLGGAMVEPLRLSNSNNPSERDRQLEALTRYVIQHAENFAGLLGGRKLTGHVPHLMTNVQPRTTETQASLILRLLPEDAGPRALLLLPVFGSVFDPASVLATMPTERRDPWLEWALMHRNQPDAPLPPGQAQGDWPAALLVRVASLDVTRLSPTQRLTALECWSQTTSLFDENDYESSFKGRDLGWLNGAAPDPAMEKAAGKAAEAMIGWLALPRSSWSNVSPGGESSIAQTTIKPLLVVLERAGLQEQRRALLRAAAMASRLSMDDLFRELRSSTDARAACADWLPLYFHSAMDSGPKSWRYDFKHLPALTAADERIAGAVDSAGLDEACRMTARLVLAFLPDDATAPPAIPRLDRARAALAGIDPNNPPHLAALNRLLRIEGAAETMLPEVLPALRCHPVVVEWLRERRLESSAFAFSNPLWNQHIRMVTLTAAGEALVGGGPQMWNQWIEALVKAAPAMEDNPTQIPVRMPRESQWLWTAAAELSTLQQQWETTHPPAEWSQMLPLWEALAGGETNAFPHDFPMALRARIAMAQKTAQGREEALRHLAAFRWHPLSIDLAVDTWSRCQLTPEECLQFLVASQSGNRAPSARMLIKEADKKGVMTQGEWHQIIPTAPPESLARLADGLIDWLREEKNDSGLLLLARRLATLDAERLNSSVWTKLATAAHQGSDAALEEDLQRKADALSKKK